MKKLFYYFLIATLAFNFVGCSDKDKDLDDVIDEWKDKYGDEDLVQIDGCTYLLNKENKKASLQMGGIMPYGTTTILYVKGDFVIPKTITYNAKTYTVTKVKQAAFSNNKELTSLTFSDNIEDIGSGNIPATWIVNEQDKNYRWITGKGLKTINVSQGFMENITLIFHATTPPEISSEYNFGNYKEDCQTLLRSTKPKLYVSKESIEAYKAHDVWKYCTIGSIEEDLED